MLKQEHVSASGVRKNEVNLKGKYVFFYRKSNIFYIYFAF